MKIFKYLLAGLLLVSLSIDAAPRSKNKGNAKTNKEIAKKRIKIPVKSLEDRLKLTEEQKAEWRKIEEKDKQEFDKAKQQMTERIDKQRAKTEKNKLKTLTPEQVTLYDKIMEERRRKVERIKDRD